MAPSDGEEDLISALPDDVLHHVLSFLPSDDAVRTSLLARRWLHLWKSARAIRVTPRPACTWPWTVSTLTNFMNHLLLLRVAGAAPLDECDFLAGQLHDDYDDRARLWIRHALTICQALVLRVCLQARRRLCLDNAHLASQRLTTVELTDATFEDSDSCIDFSRCPVLEDLTMSSCRIYANRICSRSLSRLSIDGCAFHWTTRTRISTPRLISLRLEVSCGRAPFLENMPLLAAANVRIDDGSRDSCYCINEDGSGVYLENLSSCDSCYGTDDGSSVLLEGLSGATDLELTSDPRVFILRKDCKSRTTFNKLKTLLLNEWCMAVDFGALVYFLRCAPVLEKLTLTICSLQTRHPVVKTDGPAEQLSLASKHLMLVEIKCREQNELVKKLLMLLTSNGNPLEKIRVEQN
ncbi:hypothetical protein PVAP13_8KG137800, partial [Panicum virgatum]